VHVCKKCLPSGHVFLLQSQIILSLLRQTRQQWNSRRLRICQQAAEHGEYIKGPGGTLQVRAPVVGFGAEAPLKPFVHFHTKAGLTVKDLTDSQCPRLIASCSQEQCLLLFNGSVCRLVTPLQWDITIKISTVEEARDI